MTFRKFILFWAFPMKFDEFSSIYFRAKELNKNFRRLICFKNKKAQNAKEELERLFARTDEDKT